MGESQSLQERYAPASTCFGCGPANAKGLRIRSFVEGDVTVAEWTPEPHHEAFPGILNGGIIGTLMDCHSNWTAAYHLMRRAGAETPPGTVTADYAVRFLRPTPGNGPVRVTARIADSSEDRITLDEGADAQALRVRRSAAEARARRRVALLQTLTLGHRA